MAKDKEEDMRVYIKNTKSGLVDIETNVSKVTTLEDGRIKVTYDNEGSWMTVSTVYKDSIIKKVEK